MIQYQLKQWDWQTLYTVVSRQQPMLLPFLKQTDPVPLTTKQCEILREIVASELCTHGLDENYEPNEWGIELERLIDKLGEVTDDDLAEELTTQRLLRLAHRENVILTSPDNSKQGITLVRSSEVATMRIP